MQTCIGESKFLNIESKHQSKEFELQDEDVSSNPIFEKFNLINFFTKKIFLSPIDRRISYYIKQPKRIQ